MLPAGSLRGRGEVGKSVMDRAALQSSELEVEAKRKLSWRELGALSCFAVAVGISPLLFGAVDRVVQIGIAGVLMVGFALQRPHRLSRVEVSVFFVLVATLLASQFIPAGGVPGWRAALSDHSQLALPHIRHPEPMRLLDAATVLLLAAALWQWSRSLAADRRRRLVMFCIIAGSGVLMSAVCFAIRGEPSGQIFGVRPTPGWTGWGPFPNRNHTACFLGMCAISAAGLTFWAASKRRLFFSVITGLACVTCLSALLASRSRGALIAFAAAFLALLIVAWVRARERKGRLLVFASLAIATIAVAAMGGQLLVRFTSRESGQASNDLRRAIWSDTAKMWAETPWAGQGVGMFEQLFPFYASSAFDGSPVLHPESSWLLWVAEAGALPVLAVLAIAIGLIANGIRRQLRVERRAFILTAAASAGVLCLLIHSIYDVPAHRWGTASLGVALLAIAFPVERGRRLSAFGPLVPTAILLFWAIPYGAFAPWSPTELDRRLAAESHPAPRGYAPPPRAAHAHWSALVDHFPLSATARHYAGLSLLAADPSQGETANEEFRLARHLARNAWPRSIAEARALRRNWPALSVLAWQDAVQRAGRRGAEVLRAGVAETSDYSSASVLWSQFVEAHPRLGLAFARAQLEELNAPPAVARAAFDRWWNDRAGGRAASSDEHEDFAAVVSRLGAEQHLDQWLAAYPDQQRRDFLQWVRIYAGWQALSRAWEVYSQHRPEPPWAGAPADATEEALRRQFSDNRDRPDAALQWAEFLHATGDTARGEAVILECAGRAGAPVWTLRKAAHILARRNRLAEAIDLALRESAPRSDDSKHSSKP